MGHGGDGAPQVGDFLTGRRQRRVDRFPLRETPSTKSGSGRRRSNGLASSLLFSARGALPRLHRGSAAERTPNSAAEFRISAFGRFAAASVSWPALWRPHRVSGRAERLAGRLHASLDYGQVDGFQRQPARVSRGHRLSMRADPHALHQAISVARLNRPFRREATLDTKTRKHESR
jgi:hypothetical protein